MNSNDSDPIFKKHPYLKSQLNHNVTESLQQHHFPYLWHDSKDDSNSADESDSDAASSTRNPTTRHLDHAASTLYSVPLLNSLFHENISRNLYLNPHSQNKDSIATQSKIENVRHQILQFFHTDASEYSVIFTMNASHAFKLFAEAFQFSEQCPKWRYMMQCHNSVLGMREILLERGVTDVKHFHEMSDLMEDEGLLDQDASGDNSNNGAGMVVTYPAECNSTGIIYPIRDWIKQLKDAYRKKNCSNDSSQDSSKSADNIIFFLDAAKYAATADLDLSHPTLSPDFVAVSFYKMFGYPTGLGALLVKNDKRHLMKKTYFSGGTVLASVADERFHRFRKEIWEQFEDGTLPFLDIISLGHFLKHTLPAFHYTDMAEVHKHTAALGRYVREELAAAKHYNGAPLCEIYGQDNQYEHGSIVNFNLKRSNGEYIGYSEIEQLTSLHNINVRTGCFCNAGACQVNLKMDASRVIENFESGHVCWDGHDLINGSPSGSVRISFGYCSTLQDAKCIVDFLRTHYVESSETVEGSQTLNRVYRYRLGRICMYPIKSCLGAKLPESWELTPTGFLYDREWVLINDKGKVLTLKHNLSMGSIQPTIDPKKRVMRLTVVNPGADAKSGDHASSSPPLEIPLDEYPSDVVSFPIFGTEAQGLRYGKEVNQWFSSILGFPTYLVRKDPSKARESHHEKGGSINYSNEGQYLCITRSSMEDLQEKLIEKYGREAVPSTTDWLIERFRPNFVVEDSPASSGLAFAEDYFSNIQIGSQQFYVQGPCKRCSMINVDTSKLSRENEPLKTLFSYRKQQGRVMFGVLLARVTKGEATLRIGDAVRCEVDEEHLQKEGNQQDRMKR